MFAAEPLHAYCMHEDYVMLAASDAAKKLVNLHVMPGRRTSKRFARDVRYMVMYAVHLSLPSRIGPEGVTLRGIKIIPDYEGTYDYATKTT